MSKPDPKAPAQPVRDAGNPLNPPTTEMQVYWAALGRFVHEFAHVEKMLAVVLWRFAGVSIQVAQSVFSGVRADTAMSFISRLLVVNRADQGTKDGFQRLFTHLGHINAMRNLILHYGTEFGEGEEFRTSNRLMAVSESSLRDWPTSTVILEQMTTDLRTVSAHLTTHHGRGWIPEEVLKSLVGDRLGRSWLYKPPLPSSPQGRNPSKTPKQKRPPRSSRA